MAEIPETNITGTGDIKREEFKMFSDVSDEKDNSEWELMGSKMEDLAIAMNPNVETITDVTGVTTTALDKYEENADVSTYRARRDSKLSRIVYDIVKQKKTLSEVERDFLFVNLFSGTDGKWDAWKQKAVIAVQSYGGDTKGLNIPFKLHFIGERTYGTAAISGGNVTFSENVVA